MGSVRGPPRARASPTGIVISSSTASPSEGTSSDSCLTFSAGDGPGALSGRLAAQGLVGTCSPLRLASPLLGAQSATPVLQAQGAPGGVTLLPISFQEGRRASDTSLTQGGFPFHAHSRLSQKMLCSPGGHHSPGAQLGEQQSPGVNSVSRGLVLKAQGTPGCPAVPNLQEAAPLAHPGSLPVPRRHTCPPSTRDLLSAQTPSCTPGLGLLPQIKQR